MKDRSRKGRLLTSNARRLGRYDPTRTHTLRRVMLTALRRRFGLLKSKVVQLLLSDSFHPTLNTDRPRDEHGRFTTVLEGGHRLAFIPHEKQRPDETTIMVDPSSLDDSWKQGGGDMYIPKGGGGGEIEGRRKGVEDFIAKDKPFQASRGTLYEGHFDFIDGRHRFSVLRDKGASAVAVTVPKSQAKEIATRFGPTLNRFQFQSSDSQLASFQDWLRTQVTETGIDSPDLWERYVQQGFRKGAGRAFDDSSRSPRPLTLPISSPEDYGRGARDSFLGTTLAQPTTVAKVKLLAGRTYTDLKNVTHDMGTRMGRVLADGLVKGQSSREVARTLAREVDIGLGRAEKVARTELTRCHSDGQLTAFKALGVQELGVEVEFSTADGSACPACSALDGTVTPIDEASGIIPVHPECRCAWKPSVPRRTRVQNYSPDQVRGPDGRWLGQSARHTAALNKLENGLGNSEGLSAKQYDHYHESLTKVLGRMTEGAADRVSRHLKSTRFYPSHLEMTKDIAKTSLEAEKMLAQGVVAGGAYNINTGRLSLDGGDYQASKFDKLTTEGVYAHELGHAIDGAFFGRLSETPEWKAAYLAEGKLGNISLYARESPAEGFAEFSRLLHARDGNARTASETFPRCYAVWESHGLVPKSLDRAKSPTGNTLAGTSDFTPLLPVLFTGGMLTLSGLYLDII